MTLVIDPVPRRGLGAIARAVLDTLPDWFGIPEANDTYVAFVDAHDTWTATTADGTVVGLISGRRHFPETAEIELLAVVPASHRGGVGRALLDAFEAFHRAGGVRMIEVKTLGPSNPDEGYAKTRAFYLGVGFLPIEELDIWAPENPALLMVKPVGPVAG